MASRGRFHSLRVRIPSSKPHNLAIVPTLGRHTFGIDAAAYMVQILFSSRVASLMGHRIP